MAAASFVDRLARIEARRGIILARDPAAPPRRPPSAQVGALPRLAPPETVEAEFRFEALPLTEGDSPRRFLTGFAWTLLSFAILLLAPHLPGLLAGLGFDPATQATAQRILMIPAAISATAWGIAIFVIAIWYNRWEKTAAFGCGTALGALIPLCLNWAVGTVI